MSSSAGFRRRPATQELPLTQHGQRTDTHFIERRIPATTGHARVSPNAARSTHGHTCHRAQDSGDDRPRKSFPLRSTVDAPIHISSSTGFRRRPATPEPQHGRRTDMQPHTHTKDSGDDRPRKSFPLRSTVDAPIHISSSTGFRRRPATPEPQHGRRTDMQPHTHTKDSGDDRPRKSFPLRSTVDAPIHISSSTGFRRRPATPEPQHGRRTDTQPHTHTKDSGDDRPRKSFPLRSTVDARIHEEHAISQCHLLPQGNNQMSQHLYYSCFC